MQFRSSAFLVNNSAVLKLDNDSLGSLCDGIEFSWQKLLSFLYATNDVARNSATQFILFSLSAIMSLIFDCNVDVLENYNILQSSHKLYLDIFIYFPSSFYKFNYKQKNELEKCLKKCCFFSRLKFIEQNNFKIRYKIELSYRDDCPKDFKIRRMLWVRSEVQRNIPFLLRNSLLNAKGKYYMDKMNVNISRESYQFNLATFYTGEW